MELPERRQFPVITKWQPATGIGFIGFYNMYTAPRRKYFTEWKLAVSDGMKAALDDKAMATRSAPVARFDSRTRS